MILLVKHAIHILVHKYSDRAAEACVEEIQIERRRLGINSINIAQPDENSIDAPFHSLAHAEDKQNDAGSH